MTSNVVNISNNNVYIGGRIYLFQQISDKQIKGESAYGKACKHRDDPNECNMGDVQGNLEKAAQFVEDAAEKGSQIICLPKRISTGYHLNYLGRKNSGTGFTYFQDSVQFLSNVARKNKVYLIAPIPEVREIKGVLYNSALLFNDEGDLEGS